ncbi:hypothetical protein ABT300_35780 [Streptomyces sp. NPDC001027]|uniref:hypothetical protein n=1 Tax=Streptomyces sp. NPDC001027 TaxID=3154771 RepID=UPI00333089EF
MALGDAVRAAVRLVVVWRTPEERRPVAGVGVRAVGQAARRVAERLVAGPRC